MYQLLRLLADTEDLFLEPSALAGFPGPVQLLGSNAGRDYLKTHQLEHKMGNATHILWATGGGMVPQKMMDEFYNKGLR